MGSTTWSDRAHDPARQGYKPEEENRIKGTERNDPTEAHIAPASDERGPADGDPDGRWFEMDTNPLGDKNLKNEFYELAEWWPDDFDGEACLALYSKLRRDGVDWNQMEETFGFVTGRNSPSPSLDKFLSDWRTYWDQSQSLEDEPDDADDQKPREREAAGGYIYRYEQCVMDAPF